MRVMHFVRPAVVMLSLALASPAFAQNVTTADIQRLQDQVYDAGNEVSRRRSRAPYRAAPRENHHDEVRDGVGKQRG